MTDPNARSAPRFRRRGPRTAAAVQARSGGCGSVRRSLSREGEGCRAPAQGVRISPSGHRAPAGSVVGYSRGDQGYHRDIGHADHERFADLPGSYPRRAMPGSSSGCAVSAPRFSARRYRRNSPGGIRDRRSIPGIGRIRRAVRRRVPRPRSRPGSFRWRWARRRSAP